VVLILDNGTTAMTGHAGASWDRAHAGSRPDRQGGLRGSGALAGRAQCARDRPTQDPAKFQELIQSCLDKPELSVVIARRDCLLATRAIREYERCNEQQPTNVVIAGLGGQGVLKASDILADVAFSAGLDVKKSECTA
jgi:TPP-dependent indolepyruvate ferredoxin oxidoreductase alpha subunit